MKWMGLTALAAGALLAIRAAPPAVPCRSSTIAIGDGSRLVAANSDSGSLTVIDTQAQTRVGEIPVCDSPTSVAVDGDFAFTACAEGRIVKVDVEAMRVVAAATAGSEPSGVIVDAGRLYVSDFGEASLLVLDAGSLEVIDALPMAAAPRGLAVDRASGKLYVTHFRTGEVTIVDLETLATEKVVSTGPDGNLSASITLARGRAYVPQTRSNSVNRALLFDNTVFPVVNVIELETGELLGRERLSLDVVDAPVNMPFDSVVTSAGRLYVVNAGSDDVSVVDLRSGERAAHIEVGSNPRGIALSPDERTVYVNNALSGTI
jgi:YVTN family beta-propeller protein